MKKPEKNTVEQYDFFKCLEYIESLGHKGFKDKMWNGLSGDVFMANGATEYLDHETIESWVDKKSADIFAKYFPLDDNVKYIAWW